MIQSTSAAAQANGTAVAETMPPAKSTDIASKEVFLKLLVAQIKNQDPLKPTDGTQFLSQLAQFSELEQLIGIRSELESMRTEAEEPAESPASSDGQAQFNSQV